MPAFKPEIRLCVKLPSSKHMSQSDEHKQLLWHQIMGLCQPGKHVSLKDVAATLKDVLRFNIHFMKKKVKEST